MRLCMRHLKRFDLKTLCSKTKYDVSHEASYKGSTTVKLRAIDCLSYPTQIFSGNLMFVYL